MNREEYRARFWQRAVEDARVTGQFDPYADADRQTNRHMTWADNLSVPPWVAGPIPANLFKYYERNSS